MLFIKMKLTLKSNKYLRKIKILNLYKV